MAHSDQIGQKAEAAEKISGESRRSARPRGVTMLKLQWLAERVRKVERIKKQIEAGTYSVDSHEVAKRVLGFDGNDEV